MYKEANARHFEIKTVRFWVWTNGGPVKISLPTDGTPLSYSHRWGHEEGWSAEGATFYVDGDRVVRESWTDGRDCDGRMSSESVADCHFTRLSARWVGECAEGHDVYFTRGDGIPGPCNGFTRTDDGRYRVCDAPASGHTWLNRFPAWEPVDARQRDYTAEAMGY